MIAQCLDCGMRMLSKRRWDGASPEVRAQFRAAGCRRGHGHGLCSACWRRRNRRGDVMPYEAEPVAMKVVAEEWAWIASPWRSDEENAADLAPRLGMSPGALLKAVRRLRTRGVLPEARSDVA